MAAPNNNIAVQFVEEAVMGLSAALRDCKFRFFIFYAFYTGTILLRCLEDLLLVMRGEVLIVNIPHRLNVLRERILSGVLESLDWTNYLELRNFLEGRMYRKTFRPLRAEFQALTALNPDPGSFKAMKLTAVSALLGRICESSTLLFHVCGRYPVPPSLTAWLQVHCPDMHRSTPLVYPLPLVNGLPGGFPNTPIDPQAVPP